MRQSLHSVNIQTHGKQLYDITGEVLNLVCSTRVEIGLLSVYCRHTAASLIIQENADPSVQVDICRFFDRLVDETDVYEHWAEGSDDMPAHIRTALTQSHLSIPIANGVPVLGAWQAIYLFEHRTKPHCRELMIHILVL
jgi:secondary thiamine-phosphate synthase enzyme